MNIKRWNTAYHSGMSASSDLRAAIECGVAVGVVASLLTISQLIRALPRHLDQGGFVFIDSGAFAAFQKREEVNWKKVIFAYEAVLDATNQPGHLNIVAPDVIGDQELTIELWYRFAARVRHWIDAGARVIVPLQKGARTAGQMLAIATEIFGTNQFAAGIPSNLEAMTAVDCLTLRHSDFHVLGRVALTDELREKVSALLKANPNAHLTSDANWLRSRVSRLASVPTFRCDYERVFLTRRTQAVMHLLKSESYDHL